MKVPFLDLKAQYEPLQAELEAAVLKVLRSQCYALGEEVEMFERGFAAYCGAQYCVGLNSGTSALILALKAMGIGPGDEVLTVPQTFFATSEAINWVGAMPVFVDVDEKTRTMDPSKIEQAVNPKTKAIIPVHLYGHSADMDPILEIAGRHKLWVLEDAAQAHGAKYKGKRVGALGHAACFSFYPTKNLGACGEAGAVVTSDENLAVAVQKLRNHGGIQRYRHDLIGMNARMEAIQGAVLNIKLKHVEEWNQKRRANANRYHQLLQGARVVLPQTAEWAESVFNSYVVCSSERDRLIDHLNQNHVGSLIYYPNSLHLLDVYKSLGYRKGDLPVSERLTAEVLSLPIYPELTHEQIEYVAGVIQEEWKL
ncbi:MAG: DegT/DnrJ/EryC1/StrS family aminotransferase [Candidatus Omnitrophica bacterium]|nr:DegT/DnrJ/EryC1/StrS family aminotransferase [Candidatus Omnitrophota bacterium]